MKRITVGFTGDLSFSGYFENGYKKENLFHKEIIDFFDKNDANIINYESPITLCRRTKKQRLAHRSDPEVIDYLKSRIRNVVFSLANNHMMDYGSIGMIDTIDLMEKKNVPFIGAGRNILEASKYYIVGDEIKVGIFSVEYKKLRKLTSDFVGPLHEEMTDIIKSIILELNEKVDWVVMVYHGGDEFVHVPMPYVRNLMKKFIKFGCDAIVAHHPHVVQGYEFIDNRPVFYSLGNFMFDTDYQRAQKDTERGMLIRLIFDKEKITFEKLETCINRETMTVEKGKNIEYFSDLNTINYSVSWCSEATRKKEILLSAKKLKENQLNLKKERRREEIRLVNAIRKEYMRQYEGTDNLEKIRSLIPEMHFKRKKKPKYMDNMVRKVYKKLYINRKNNYKKFIVIIGQIKYKIFYMRMNNYKNI